MKRSRHLNFQEIRLVMELASRTSASSLLATLEEVYEETKDLLANRIPIVFDKYTLHDINHSIRIMEYMYDLIEDVRDLSDIEIVVLCYSAILHDVGMAADDAEITLIKTDRYTKSNLYFSAFVKIYKDEHIALQEFIRKFHAQRSYDYVITFLKQKLHIPYRRELAFAEVIGKICQSHNENFEWILRELKSKSYLGTEAFNPQYCASLLRLADILDIDGQRTPHRLYEFIKPLGYSKGEWEQHYTIQNDKKIIRNKSGKKELLFSAICKDPKIHRKLLSYIDWVKMEFKNCLNVTRDMESIYQLNFVDEINLEIEAQGYSFIEHKMRIDFRAVTDLLAGERLYGDQKYGLRELIQNSLDACRIRMEDENMNKDAFYSEKYLPKIKIIIDRKNSRVVVSDNGIGMDIDVIQKFFLNVGTSYYKSLDFRLKNYKFNPIGNFGIGFLACFMLSPSVRVVTRNKYSNIKYEIDIEKHSEHTSIHEYKDLSFIGTEIILNYDSFELVFPGDTASDVLEFVKSNFVTNNISIEIIDTAESKLYPVKNDVFEPANVESEFFKVNKRFTIEFSNEEIGIQGSVELKPFTPIIINSFENFFSDEIDLRETVFFLSENLDLERFSDKFKISEFLVDNRIAFFAFPLSGPNKVTGSLQIEKDKFFGSEIGQILRNTLRPISRTGLVTGVSYENLDFGSESICIFLKISTVDRILDKDSVYRNGILKSTILNVIDLFSPDFIENLRLLKFLGGQVVYNQILLSRSHNSDNYIRLIEIAKNTINSNQQKVYLKDVLIRNEHFGFELYPDYYAVVGYKLNIWGDGVFTNVSRDKLEFYPKHIANNYLIALHKGIIEGLNISEDSRKTLIEALTNYFKQRMLLQV